MTRIQGAIKFVERTTVVGRREILHETATLSARGRLSAHSHHWEAARQSASFYALPARYFNPQCPSLFTEPLTWPNVQVWRLGQVSILPYIPFGTYLA